MPVSEWKEKRLRRQVRPGQGRPRCVLHKDLDFTQKAAAVQLAGVERHENLCCNNKSNRSLKFYK